MEKMIDFLSMTAKQLTEIQISTAGVMLAIGLLNCFLGYRLLRVWVSLAGFSIGALAGYTWVSHYTRSSLAQIGIVFLAGVLLGMTAFYIYRVGVFLLCANVAVVSAAILLQPQSSFRFVVCLGAGIVFGLLGITFIKPMVIFHTALGGGFSMAVSLAEILGKEADEKTMFLGMGLMAAGIIAQTVHSRKTL